VTNMVLATYVTDKTVIPQRTHGILAAHPRLGNSAKLWIITGKNLRHETASGL